VPYIQLHNTSGAFTLPVRPRPRQRERVGVRVSAAKSTRPSPLPSPRCAGRGQTPGGDSPFDLRWRSDQ
jgi:hypothetical protein